MSSKVVRASRGERPAGASLARAAFGRAHLLVVPDYHSLGSHRAAVLRNYGGGLMWVDDLFVRNGT